MRTVGDCPNYAGCHSDPAQDCSCLVDCWHDKRCCSAGQAGHALAALKKVEDHFSRAAPLSAAALDAAADVVSDGIFYQSYHSTLPAFDLTTMKAVALELAAHYVPRGEREELRVPRTGIGLLMLELQYQATTDLPPEQMVALPAAAFFPGALPAATPPLPVETVRIDANYTGRDRNYLYSCPTCSVWRNTGLWAAAGKAITVEVPAGAVNTGLDIRIGSHTDSLRKLDDNRNKGGLKRSLYVTKTWEVTQPTTLAATAYGGLIYIMVPVGAALGQITVTIRNAGGRAPWFKLGRDTDADWNQRIKDYPAPWAELEGENCIFTVQSVHARRVASPEALLNFWDARLDDFAQIEGRPQSTWRSSRTRQERWVEDIQLSSNRGVAYAGYPVPSYFGRTVIDDEKKHAHYVYHEFGHNHQYRPWMLPDTTEISNDAIFGDYSSSHGADPSVSLATISEVRGCRSGCPEYSKYFAGTKMYQHLRSFSWKLYADVLASYRDDPPSDAESSGSASKMALWATRCSQKAGKNLAPFFLSYGFDLSQAALDVMALLPTWEENPFLPPKADPAAGCVTGKGRDYAGAASVTASGRTCQAWAVDTPHEHDFNGLDGSYCRNPDGEPSPWCYTTDPEKRWELCSQIAQCRRQLASNVSLNAGLPTTADVATDATQDGTTDAASLPGTLPLELPIPQQPSAWLVNLLELSASLRSSRLEHASEATLHEMMQGDACDSGNRVAVEISGGNGGLGTRIVCLALTTPDGAPRKQAFVVLDGGDNERVVAVMRRDATAKLQA